MKGAKHSAARARAFLLEKAQNLAGQLGVEAGYWFVREHTLGFTNQGTGDSHPLAFAPGDLGDGLMCKMRDTEFFQECDGPLPVRAWKSKQRAPSRALPKQSAQDIRLCGGIGGDPEVLKNEAQLLGESFRRVLGVILAAVGDMARGGFEHAG